MNSAKWSVAAWAMAASLGLAPACGNPHGNRRPVVATPGSPLSEPPAPLLLKAGWVVQSSATVKETGDVLSSEGFRPQGWYPMSQPGTVLAALVENGVYPSPYVGKNLRQLPGVSYPIGENFSNRPMPADSPWAVPWWYRTQFTLPAGYAKKTIWLDFAGINYRANIWLNGKRVADAKEIAGALRTYRLDVTDVARPGATNVLAVEVHAPKEADLGITFVDWNPAPPDKSMGLWREVSIATSGPVAIRYPTVLSRVNSPANDRAELTVATLLKNASARPVAGRLVGRIEAIAFEQEVMLGPGEEKEVVFAPQNFPTLVLAHPRLWWPLQMGTPNLTDLDLRFEVAGEVSDASRTRFGIREIKAELDANKNRLVTVNGKKLLIRGAGYAPDLLLGYDARHVEDELDYVQDMGLNTVRLEGKLASDHFFESTDRRGLLVIAGWCCCDHFEHWDRWTAEDHAIAAASLRSQLYRLRSHPSLAIWMNGSDFAPPPAVEEAYLRIERELRWPNGIVSSATAKPTSVSGPSGVKMSGPYEWVAPRYWLEDTTHGGAVGFNTETSPGPAPPPVESLRRMFPADKLWPMNDVWDFHAGGDQFRTINVFTEALTNRYGKAESVEDFATKSQLMAYEGIRAMFEAYSRNKYTSTGVVQWMLNNAWPSLIWHLYDYYMRPGGGYFGAKRALEPLHPIFSYDDGSVWVVNSTYGDTGPLTLKVKVLNLDMSEKFATSAAVDLPPDGAKKLLAVPAIKDLSATYFLQLLLVDGAGTTVGSNFYWLSTRPETLRYDKTEWFRTPTASFADFRTLATLPTVHLDVKSDSVRHGDQGITTVRVTNPSRSLAFFVRLKVEKGPQGEEILPVLWQDNYVSLLPGETRELTARYDARALGSLGAAVEVSGSNVAPVATRPPTTTR